ncbi:hypothetical protein Glaag_2561 [Glaciecola sp. 4H-3-7+YE-5]|nr:hypothetical protein Glaag_2561 [Glaciecola sp. 4H-3-7+YE-5]
MISNFLDQKELFNILSDEQGWSSGEFAAQIALQSREKISSFGVDTLRNYSKEEIKEIIVELGESKCQELIALRNLNKVCDYAVLARKKFREDTSIPHNAVFGLGADSTALIIGYLLKTYNTDPELDAQELYQLLNSNKQSERALGSMRHAKKVVMQQAPDLMRRVHTDGFNPSFKEVAEHLYSLLLNKFQTDDIPELDTLKDWVRQCKPEGHNPRTGKKPNGYRSIFET